MTTIVEIPGNEPTLYFDTEKSGESYVHLYADEPGHKGPLWPAPIPVIGVCGELGQGKTTFLLDIANGPVKRIDLPAEMLKWAHANNLLTYRPMDTYLWWLSIVRSIPPKRFRVIALDVAEEIETGLADWVWEHPLHFNKTKDQYIKMRGLYWGDVSALWKSILADLASRCETFAFSNHMGAVWTKSGEATDKRKHKGKRVLSELASLYVKLERPKDATGSVAMIPAGITDLTEGCKSRLMTKITRPDGSQIRVAVLPPRMPEATPAAIRNYFAHPAYGNGGLRPEELSPDKQLTEAQTLELRRDAAAAEAEAERLKIERMRTERQAETASAPTPTALPSGNGAVADQVGRPAGAVNGQANVSEGHPQAPPVQPVPQPETPPAATSAPEPEETTERQRLRDAITAAVQRLNLPADQVQARIREHILAVNEGVDAAMGRLGPKKLAAILARLEGKPLAPPPAQPPQAPVTFSSPNGKRPRPEGQQQFINQIRDCWEELAFHLKIPADQKDAALSPLLQRYGVAKIVDLNMVQLIEVEAMLVDKLRNHYAAVGKGECPF